MTAPAATALTSPQVVFLGIIEGLYTGRYAPGQRLVEPDLIRDYGVSRGTVREALNRLAAEGVVRLNPHRGAEIRRLTRLEAQHNVALLELLIGLAARLAAERIGQPGQRALFDQGFERLMALEHRSDSFDMIRARNRFYRTLVQIGGNSELARMLPTLSVHLLRIQFRGYAAAMEAERFDDYRGIAEAVRAGSGRRAEAAGRRHVARLTAMIEQIPDSAFAPEREAEAIQPRRAFWVD